MKTVWIPEAPEHSGLYAVDPDGPKADRCVMGDVFTYDPHSAMQFDSEAKCRAWCEAHPEPTFVPREHGFVEDTP